MQRTAYQGRPLFSISLLAQVYVSKRKLVFENML